MENNIENKYSFFAQYWNVESHKMIAKPNLYKVGRNGLFVGEFDYLVLKPLSSITDDELGTIARFYNRTATNVYIDQDQLTFDYYHGDETHSAAVELNSGYCLDFLRSNGFAMEWMGLTVGQLQEYRWIKLKSE